MKAKYRRLKYIILTILLVCAGLWLILKNFNENIVFFFTPSEVKTKNITEDKIIRVGGLVTTGSIKRNGEILQFTITDNNQDLVIKFKGTPPNLFREGQGIVAKGKLKNNQFIASELLAKHDENYMPAEVAKALKANGTWRE